VLHHVLVDNGSANLREIQGLVDGVAKDGSGTTLVPLEANFGIGRALNEGVRVCCRNPSTRWILTLDQDTVLPEHEFSTLERELEDIPGLDHVGIVALNYAEHRFNRVRPYNRSNGPVRTNSVITSGSIVNRSVFNQIHFDEALFLYFVDVDFCHQLRLHGFPIYILRHAFIDHREGTSTSRQGQTRFYLDPPRLYFVCRNGVRIFRRYRSVKALLVTFYLVTMNCLRASTRRESIRFAARGFLASLRPKEFQPPFGVLPESPG
jgi:GT2 family glycosyltransferase